MLHEGNIWHLLNPPNFTPICLRFLFDFSRIVTIIGRFMIKVSESTMGEEMAAEAPLEISLPVDQEQQLLDVGIQVDEALKNTYPHLAVNRRRELFRNVFRTICTALFYKAQVEAEINTVQSRTNTLLQALGFRIG
jgi:hypothetical protein